MRNGRPRAAVSFGEGRYRPASRLVVTAGASGALTLVRASLIKPGRRWLLPDPGYPYNRHFVRSFEGVPVGAESNFQPTPVLLETAGMGIPAA